MHVKINMSHFRKPFPRNFLLLHFFRNWLFLRNMFRGLPLSNLVFRNLYRLFEKTMNRIVIISDVPINRESV